MLGWLSRAEHPSGGAAASHGYIIAAIDHTYDAAATVFPDGRVALHNDAILSADTSSTDLQLAVTQLVKQRVGDLAFVLDQLKALDAADPGGRLTGRLDVSRVGCSGTRWAARPPSSFVCARAAK